MKNKSNSEIISKTIDDNQAKKQEGLTQIVRIMRVYGLKYSDVIDYIKNFDYIMFCEQEDTKVALKSKARTIANLRDGLFPSTEGQFDLLCVIGKKLKRVPFDVGKNLHKVGIFPFKDSSIALRLDEQGFSFRYNVKQNELPSIQFFKRLQPIIHRLNNQLQKLSKPIITGHYFALDCSDVNSNVIVEFIDSPEREFLSDTYDINVTAKVRYIIVHGGL